MSKTTTMQVFDKPFEVEFISCVDQSSPNFPNVTVKFKVEDEIYYYTYKGSISQAFSSVMKENKATKKIEQVYSAYKHIENGSYYDEIGRRLSVEHRKKN